MEFKRRIRGDCERCDLLIVMGSSLRVQPVGFIPTMIGELHPETPQILINLECVGWPHQFDYMMLEECDSASRKLLEALGWSVDDIDKPVEGIEPREENSALPDEDIDDLDDSDDDRFTTLVLGSNVSEEDETSGEEGEEQNEGEDAQEQSDSHVDNVETQQDTSPDSEQNTPRPS